MADWQISTDTAQNASDVENVFWTAEEGPPDPIAFTVAAAVSPTYTIEWIGVGDAPATVTVEVTGAAWSVRGATVVAWEGTYDYDLNIADGSPASDAGSLVNPPEPAEGQHILNDSATLVLPVTAGVATVQLLASGTIDVTGLTGFSGMMSNTVQVNVGVSLTAQDVGGEEPPPEEPDQCTGERIDISEGLALTFDLEGFGSAVCIKIERRDGTVVAMTGHDQALTVGGTEYLPDLGMNCSALRQQVGLSVDNFEFEGHLVDTGVTAADINDGFYDGAKITLLLVDWEDLSKGSLTLFRGYVGEITVTPPGFKAEARSLKQKFAQVVGRVYAPTCDATFCDSRCGLNIADYTVSTTVASKTDSRTFTVSDASPDDEFKNGLCTIGGRTSEVKSSSESGGVNTIVLQDPLPFEAGDPVTLVVGCQKRFTEDCVTRFSNALNFRGFPQAPRNDVATTAGSPTGTTDEDEVGMIFRG
jgi:uncharacterized phage protein (TIGR02218 family)